MKKSKLIIQLLIHIICFAAAIIIISLTASSININSNEFISVILTSAITASISGISALNMEKTNKYKKELRNELLDLSISSTIALILGISFICYNQKIIALISFLFLISGFMVFLLTIIFERLDIYETIINILYEN